MKNLKINSQKMKQVISTGMVLLSLTNLTGCKTNQGNNSNTEESSITTLVSGNKLISIEDIVLKDTETNTIITDIDAVLIGNKLEREIDLFDIIFNPSVDYILINDELIPVSRLTLVNSKTNTEITEIEYIIIKNELISPKDYVNNSTNSEYEFNFNNNSASQQSESNEYEELTDEKFYALVDEISKSYIDEYKLDVTREEIIDFLMFVNIDKLHVDNKELINTIIGNRDISLVELNVFNVHSAIMTKNNESYCAKGLGWDSLILVSNTVFDKEERETVASIENRIKEIFEARNDKDEFNKLLNTLLMEMLNSSEEEFNMDNGAGYSVMNILINFIRRNFTSSLDQANSELIKYFISYAEEYNTSYYENSRSTAYYSGIYNLVTKTLECSNVRTK